MPLADLSAQVAAATDGSSTSYRIIKTGRHNGAAAVATVAGRWTDLAPQEGTPAAAWAGTVPGAEASFTNSSLGAVNIPDAAVGHTNYLTGITINLGAVFGHVILYDKLAIVGQTDSAVALSGTVTTAQVITLDPPARANGAGTTSVGNRIAVGISTQIGTTATTATIAYNDQDNNAAENTVAFNIGATGFREQHRLLHVPLNSGDTGVMQVDNIDLLATTGTAGQLYIMLYKVIWEGYCPLGGITQNLLSGITSGPGIALPDGVSPHLMVLAGNAAVPTVDASLIVTEVAD